jgi:hypothetical protein
MRYVFRGYHSRQRMALSNTGGVIVSVDRITVASLTRTFRPERPRLCQER